MGPIWGWQDPGGPHIGPMNFALWGSMNCHVLLDHVVITLCNIPYPNGPHSNYQSIQIFINRYVLPVNQIT